MSGTTNDPAAATVDVVVVGGGLAGLAAAVAAADAGRTVTLLDAHGLGGRARTQDRNGYLFNTGPHALYVDGPGHRVLQGFGIDPPGRRPTPSTGRRCSAAGWACCPVARSRCCAPICCGPPASPRWPGC